MQNLAHTNPGRGTIAHEVAMVMLRYRAAHSMSLTALARQVGTHQPAIARLEAGRHTPSVAQLEQLAAAGVLTVKIGRTGAHAAIVEE